MRARCTAILVVVAGLLAFGVPDRADSQTNRLSPHESTSGTIDGADIMITYGRPSMRGRRIMGALVGYDEDWTPGADEATILETSRAVRIGEVAVAAGQYSVWMRPTADRWTMFLNQAAHLYHTANRNRRDDLEGIVLRLRTLDRPVEQLTFTIEQNATGRGGVIAMTWETTAVSAPVVVME
jgi:hypothetical protein